MSVVLDEDTVVLDALDFDVPCKTCAEPAVSGISAVCCGVSTLKCADCYADWEQEVIAKLGRAVRCWVCSERGPLSFDWYRVVPL